MFCTLSSEGVAVVYVMGADPLATELSPLALTHFASVLIASHHAARGADLTQAVRALT